jgi:ParB family transcriptional regulator, chromosome partitioning protein
MTGQGKPRGVAGRLAALTQVSDEGPEQPVRPAFRAQQAIDGRVVGLQEQVRSLEASLAAEQGDRATLEAELARLRAIAERAGDSATEFVLLDPGLVRDPQPTERLSNGFRDAAFYELLRDVEAQGQNDAITVRPARSGNGYEIAAGRRRLEACRQLGRSVLARVRTLDDEAMDRVQFAENERRKDICTIERARWFAAVQERRKLAARELAERFGLDRTTMVHYLRIAKLPVALVERFADPRALSLLKARRLMDAVEADPEAVARILSELDRQAAVVTARGGTVDPAQQIDLAIKVAEGRRAAHGSRSEEDAERDAERRPIIHRGRRLGTLTRSGGQWVIRFAASAPEGLAWRVADRIAEIAEEVDANTPHN